MLRNIQTIWARALKKVGQPWPDETLYYFICVSSWTCRSKTPLVKEINKRELYQAKHLYLLHQRETELYIGKRNVSDAFNILWVLAVWNSKFQNIYGRTDWTDSCVSESCILQVVTYTVAFLTRGSWVLFRPATENLQADSPAVLYFPEDGRLTFEGWVVVVKKSDSPRQSPNTNGFNNHYAVQWSNPVVETSAGGPLISMRLFAGGKCSACLV